MPSIFMKNKDILGHAFALSCRPGSIVVIIIWIPYIVKGRYFAVFIIWIPYIVKGRRGYHIFSICIASYTKCRIFLEVDLVNFCCVCYVVVAWSALSCTVAVGAIQITIMTLMHWGWAKCKKLPQICAVVMAHGNERALTGAKNHATSRYS